MVTLRQDDKHAGMQDSENTENIKIMNKAVDEIMKNGDQKMRKIMYAYQRHMRDILKERTEQETLEKSKPMQSLEHFRFSCGKCRAFAFNASDVQLVNGTQHVVVSHSFLQRADFRDLEKPSCIGYQDLYKHGQLLCKACHFKWGVQMLFEREINLPVVKGGQFLFEDARKPTDGMKAFQTWNELHINFKKAEDPEQAFSALQDEHV